MYYFKILNNVCGKNEYSIVDEFHFQKNNTQVLYFQLFKANASGDLIRYIPEGDISNLVVAKFFALDDSSRFERSAVIAFAGDLATYKITIGPADCISFGGMSVVLTETSMVAPPAPTPTSIIEKYFESGTDLAVHVDGQLSYRV